MRTKGRPLLTVLFPVPNCVSGQEENSQESASETAEFSVMHLYLFNLHTAEIHFHASCLYCSGKSGFVGRMLWPSPPLHPTPTPAEQVLLMGSKCGQGTNVGCAAALVQMAVALLNLFLERSATCATSPGDLQKRRGVPGRLQKASLDTEAVHYSNVFKNKNLYANKTTCPWEGSWCYFLQLLCDFFL